MTTITKKEGRCFVADASDEALKIINSVLVSSHDNVLGEIVSRRHKIAHLERSDSPMERFKTHEMQREIEMLRARRKIEVTNGDSFEEKHIDRILVELERHDVEYQLVKAPEPPLPPRTFNQGQAR